MSPVSAVIAENAVVLVGVPGCGYCARAKDMLINAGQEFRFYELSRDESGDAMRQELDQLAGFGRRTVPYLWVHGKYAGGCNDGPESWMGVRRVLRPAHTPARTC